MSHDKVILGRVPLVLDEGMPLLEVLRKPTLTLFVKKPFLFWRKNFSRNKIYICPLLHKAAIQDNPSFNWLLQITTLMSNLRVAQTAAE